MFDEFVCTAKVCYCATSDKPGKCTYYVPIIINRNTTARLIFEF